MDTANPLDLLENYPIAETKKFISEIKKDLNDAMSEDGEVNEETEILMCVIESLEKELAKVKKIEQLPKEKQARILADTCFILQCFQYQGFINDNDDEFIDDYDDEEEEDER